MAFHYSPKIVTDGLVLYLDAANPKSFSTASNTWIDISKGEYNGSISGATFSSLKSGAVVFDGIDDYVEIPNTTSLLPSVGSGTIDFVYKLNATASTDFRNIWGLTNNLFQYENNAGLMRFVWRYDDLLYNGLSSGIIYGDFNIYHITCTYTSTIGSSTFKMYKNGIFVGNITYQKSLHSAANSIRLGTPFTNPNESNNCTIFNFKIYNRELSATEVFQNFNATKTRFGL
jgi:hypothetical protein